MRRALHRRAAAIRPRGRTRPQWFPRSPAPEGAATRREAAVKLSVQIPAFCRISCRASDCTRRPTPGRRTTVARAGAGEPPPPLVHDVAALLEAQQHEAHLAPAEADALGELTRGEAGFVLDRAGDEPDAVEDADRAQVGQGLDGCGALE